jgi:hypothetical protein
VSWQPRGQPALQPHESIRGGTTKILTLFHPATGQVRRQPAARGTNAVLHPWLRERLSAILAALPVPKASLDPAVTRAAWAVWQAGLAMPFTLPDDLPPLRLLLVWDNLAGHKTPDLVLWLCEHGVMPLDTPVGGSWLNRAESIERVLVSAGRSTDSIRIAQTRSGAGLSRPRGTGMSSQPRLCGTANAGSGGADPIASRSTGSAAREPAHTSP